MRVNALCVGTLALATALATPAIAQAQPTSGNTPPTTPQDSASNEAVAQDIIVTAQLRSTRLQDTPLAITAVNAAMLDARGQTSIADVAAQSPNVTLRPQPHRDHVRPPQRLAPRRHPLRSLPYGLLLRHRPRCHRHLLAVINES